MAHVLRRLAATVAIAFVALVFTAHSAGAAPAATPPLQSVQHQIAGQPAQVPADLWDNLKKVNCLANPTLGVSPECAADRAVTATKAAAQVKNTIDFWKDPFGAIAGKMQEAASGLTNQVLPELIKATTPKFTVDWFVDAYRVSFGIGIALFGLLLLRTFVDFSRGKAGSEDVIDTVAVEAPRYVVGAAFGPVVAGSVVGLFEWLAVGIVKWGFNGSITSIGEGAKRLDDLIRAASPTGVPGGSITAIIVYALLIFGLILMVLIMLVVYVTLYMSGAVAPIAWAWLGHPDSKDRAWKIIRVFAGLVAAKPIAFMMLAIALMLTSEGLFGMEPGAKAVQTLVGIGAAAIALIFAAFSPMILNKFAVGVGPTEATGASPAPRFNKSNGRGTRGGPGKSTPTNGQLAQASSQGGGGGGGNATKMAGVAATTGGTGLLAAMTASAAGKFKDKLQGTTQDSAQEGTQSGGGGSTVDASNAYNGGGSDGGGRTAQDGKQGGGADDSATTAAAAQGQTGGQDQDQPGDNQDGQVGAGDSTRGAAGEESTGRPSLANAGASAGGGGSDDGAGRGSESAGDQKKEESSGGGFGKKLAGATASTAGGLGAAARIGASGLRDAAAKGDSMTDTLDEHLDAHIDHAATTGRRPR